MSGDDARPVWAARLRAERERRGWNKHEMARRLLAAEGTAYPGVSSLVRQVRGWENAEHFPRDWTTAYARAFDTDEVELFGGAECAPVPATGRVCTVDRSPAPDQGDDVKRRAALQLIAALGAGAAIPPGVLETVLSGVEEALGSPLDVDDWERTVREYGYLINRQPVGTLISDLTADTIAVGQLLSRCEGDGRPELLRVSAGLSALLAIELGDVGNRRGARKVWSTARRAADASGDRDLRVWIRARDAEEAFWADLPPSAIGPLTAEAIEIAKGEPSAGLPRAYAVRASLAAEAGDAQTAWETMDTLADVFERLPDVVTSDAATFGWNEARFRWNQAYIFTLLGDLRGERAVDDALDLYPAGTLGPIANLRVIRGIGLMNSGEINDGLEQALTTCQELPVSPARRRMAGQIQRLLPDKARALPAARELRVLAAGAHV